MAKQRFSGALNAATFPLVSVLQPRTVMQPQLDSNVKTNQAFYGSPESASYNIPQLLYCENVVPTAEGIQSVNYNKFIEGLAGAVDFDQAITLRDEDENNFIFVPAGGKNYIYTANRGNWESVNSLVGWTGKLVTRAYVNGRTFICYEGFGIYEYFAATDTFVKQSVLGLTDADIRGIGASSNYLIAFGDLTVYWSSLVNPLDFVPDLTTGAGFSIPQDVKARITAVIGISGGFVIYTAKNAVGAVFTNNTRAPFTFKEISNAGGIVSYEQVTNEQNSGPHYAWTTGGLQRITIQGAEPVSGEVSDFLAGRMYETYDANLKRLNVFYDSAVEFAVKLTYIASRFLIVSYAVGGSNIYNYALFYDTTLKRWGKLKVDHVDCFAYPYPNLFGDLSYEDLGTLTYDDFGVTTYAELVTGIISDPPSKRTIAFLSSNGEVNVLEMDYNKEVDSQAVAIFGKFQIIRAKLIQNQRISFEGVYQNTFSGLPRFALTMIGNIDGYNPALIKTGIFVTKDSSGKLAVYGGRLTAINLSYIAEGTFAFSTYIIEATTEGDQ